MIDTRSGNPFDIIVTLNGNHLDWDLLRRFVALGVTIFRLNGSFMVAEDIQSLTSRIRACIGRAVKVILDLPGFKPRFSYLDREIHYSAGEPMTVPLAAINYPDIITHLHIGDCVIINDGKVRLEIQSVTDEAAVFTPNRPGILRRGKGFHLEGRGFRPTSQCLSPRDMDLIQVAKNCGMDYVGISFVHSMADIDHVRRELGESHTGFIPKIEARESLEWENLVPIMTGCERVIVDRGDMAGETGLKNVWRSQRKVIELGKLLNCRVIMATQFFTSMLRSPVPSIAEMDSIYDLLHFGIDGVQLSEETSVGEYGLEVLKVIRDSLNASSGRGKDGGKTTGGVVWIMGPTSSGKTSLAQALTKRLAQSKVPVVHLDGDEIRDLYGPNLLFGPQDRLRVVSTLVHFARKAAQSGHNVVVSALTAHESARKLVREGLEGLTIVFLQCGIEECIRRDAKGLYAKALRGEIDTMIGVNSPYNPPMHADLTLDTGCLSVDECVDVLTRYLIENRKVHLWGLPASGSAIKESLNGSTALEACHEYAR